MKTLLAIIVSLCFVSTANAQFYGGYFSSTAGEGYMRGYGAMLAGRGYYLQSLGQYENLHQSAVGMGIRNHVDFVQSYWAIRDQYKARHHTDWAVQETRRLDAAEQIYNLRQREKDLIDTGRLPPKPTPSITVHGVKYPSVAAWKASDDYVLLQLEHQEKWVLEELEKSRAIARNRHATEQYRRWQSLSYAGQQAETTRHRVDELMGKPYVPPYPEYDDLKIKDNIYYRHLDEIRALKEKVKNR